MLKKVVFEFPGCAEKVNSWFVVLKNGVWITQFCWKPGVVPFPCKLLWTKTKAEIWIKHCINKLPFILATLGCSILVSRNFVADVNKQLPLEIRFVLPKVRWDIFKSNTENSNLLSSVSSVKQIFLQDIHVLSGLILGLRPANERQRYFVTSSPIGLVQA